MAHGLPRFVRGNTKPRCFLVNFGAFSRLGAAQLVKPTHTPCQCALQHCAGWESVNDTAWPAQQMTLVATLRDPEAYEPTFEEHHPNGTRYESADAPVALKFFPYNRCDVHACSQCQQHVLRYTEFGGYYVDHRARRLNAALITD
jgi:hypothetical protein